MANTDPEDPEHARGLVAHTLTLYVASAAVGDSETHRQIAMSVIAPALLSRASTEGGAAGAAGGNGVGVGGDLTVYRETSARLLELASADQNAFRGVVTNMNEGQKAFMEEVIRSGQKAGGGAGADRGADGNRDQPSIALKMDFGG